MTTHRTSAYSGSGHSTSGAGWSVVMPYFNEAGYLEKTLSALRAQTLRGFTLILVNNASTDDSGEIARTCMAKVDDIAVVHLHESRPGKIHALEKGFAAVSTPFVAFCDADTFYPPQYLERSHQLFAASGEKVVAVMAMDIGPNAGRLAAWRKRAKVMAVARLWPRQTHTGGFGQSFRTAVLRKAGGFSAARWPFVLEDHEVMQRVFKFGAARYAADLWCRPSGRRADRSGVNWTLAERVLYHATPFVLKDRFFYSFLKRRFAARGLDNIRLRDKTWS